MNEPIEIMTCMSLASASIGAWSHGPRHIVPRNGVPFSERYLIVPPTPEKSPVFDLRTGRYVRGCMRERDEQIVYSVYTDDGKRISRSKEEWAVWLIADDGFAATEAGVCVICGAPFEATRADQVTCGSKTCKYKNGYERNKRRRLGLIE